jgi:signal peptidase II
MSNGKRIGSYVLVAAVLIALDRWTKMVALTRLTHRITINAFLSFDLVFNRGIAWSLFHSPTPEVFGGISIVIAIITGVIAYYGIQRFREEYFCGAALCIVAGSLSNIIDRCWYGGVIDFIELTYGNYSWPLFNIADMCIVGGVGLLAMEYYYS